VIAVKKFDALKMVTDEQKFSELVFDMVSECKTTERLTELLREEMPEKELQTLKSIAQSGYPLSFGNNNVCNV
jgi:hypothetical protein